MSRATVPFHDNSDAAAVARAKAEIGPLLATVRPASTRLAAEAVIDRLAAAVRGPLAERLERSEQRHRECQVLVEQMQEVLESMLRRPTAGAAPRQ